MPLSSNRGPKLPLCAICGKAAIGVHMPPAPRGMAFSPEAARILYCAEHEKEALALSTRSQSDEKPRSS